MSFIVFFALWLIFNGNVTVQIVIVGLLLSAALAWFCARYIAREKKRAKRPLYKLLLLLEYFGILIVEIVKANIAVLSMAVARELDFSPHLIYFRTDLKNNASRVLLANSITLTPGTITVSLDDDMYCVHCLDPKLAEGIDDSVFIHMLHKIEEA